MNFRATTIGNICSVLNGRAYKQSELLSMGHYPVLRVGNFFSSDKWYFSDLELDDNKYCDKGDLLFAWSASFGPKIWDGPKVIYHYHIWKMVPNNNVNKIYLYYWLRNSVDTLTAGTHGSVMAHLTKSDMENMPISLPSLPDQQKIAAVLSALDSKIELNTKINNNLEQQAQALLARYNTDVQTRCKLGDLLRFVNGFAFKSSEYLANGIYKVITIKNVQDGKVDSQSASCIDELPAKMPTECTLKIGDVLLSLTGNVGRVGIVCEENLLLNQRVAKVCAKNPAYNAFLYFVMRQSQLKTEMENISRGTAQQNLSPVEALNLEINFNEEMTNKLSGVLKSYFDEIIRNTVESSHLAAIRDALLPKLMSGEIDVSKVDISDPSYLDKLLFSEETE